MGYSKKQLDEDVKHVDEQMAETGKVFGVRKEVIYLVGLLAIVGLWALFGGKL